MTTQSTVEVGVGGDRDKEGGWTKFEKKEGGRQYREGLHKISGLAPLCQLYQKALEISHPLIIKPTPHSWLPPISNKDFPSSQLQSFLINSIPPLCARFYAIY